MLSDYLDELSSEGQIESSGQFTVDLARARLLLFKNQLAEPAMYVLKLVQAMVRAKCTALWFVRSEAGLELFCPCSIDDALLGEEIHRALLADPTRLVDSALRDLIFGLSGAWAIREDVGFEFRGPLPWTLLPHKRPPSSTLGIGYLMRFPRFFGNDEEGRLVRQRCGFCPIPIYWNGRLLKKDSSPFPNQRVLERIVRSGVGDSGFDYHYATIPRLSPRVRLFSDQGKETLASDIYPVPSSSVLSIGTEVSRASELLLIRHGVTLEPVFLATEFDCQLVLPGDHLPLDLGQLRARESPELEQVRLKALRLMKEGARLALTHLKSVPAEDDDPFKALGIVLGLVVFGTLVAATGGLFVFSLFIGPKKQSRRASASGFQLEKFRASLRRLAQLEV